LDEARVWDRTRIDRCNKDSNGNFEIETKEEEMCKKKMMPSIKRGKNNIYVKSKTV